MLYNKHADYLEESNSGLKNVLSSATTDFSFNLLAGINPFQTRIAAAQAALVPNRYKSCKLWQAPVEWIFKTKELCVKHPCDFFNWYYFGGTRLDHDDEKSENDLADMVHDFIENGCAHDANDDSNIDSAGSFVTKLCERVQTVSVTIALSEREMISFITTLILGASESELFCPNGFTDCNAGCIRRFVAKYLKMSGYNTSICKTKWQSTAKAPGGEYEYVDINFEEDDEHKERVIIDLDFRCQFEIARPSQHYQEAMKYLPLIFVGKSGKLEQILQIMSEAAKCSLRQNSLHIPPWRTVDYMRAKWFSSCERKGIDSVDYQLKSLQSTPPTQCREQLRRLKATVKAELESAPVLKSMANGRAALR